MDLNFYTIGTFIWMFLIIASILQYNVVYLTIFLIIGWAIPVLGNYLDDWGGWQDD